MVCFEGCNEVKQPSPKWLVLVPYPVVAIYDVGRGARDKKWKIGAVFYFLVSGRRMTLETKSVRSEALSDACITRANAPVIPKKLMRPIACRFFRTFDQATGSSGLHVLRLDRAAYPADKQTERSAQDYGAEIPNLIPNHGTGGYVIDAAVSTVR